MKELGHTKIDLLKIDIEGAEYKVLASLIKDKVKPGVLCIEYDESNRPLDKNYRKRIKDSIESLIAFGYKVVFCDDSYNVTLVST